MTDMKFWSRVNFSPVEDEEGDAEAEPDADEGQLLDRAGQPVVDHLKA